eukprot:SAG31_NODE_5228_length_2662_cov_1.697620_3_plen_83_part_00
MFGSWIGGIIVQLIFIALTMGLNGAGHRASIEAGEIENAGESRAVQATGRDENFQGTWDGEGRRMLEEIWPAATNWLFPCGI